MKKLSFIIATIISLLLLFISCEYPTYQESFVSEGIVESKCHENSRTELKWSYCLKPNGKMGFRWRPTRIPAKNEVYFRYTREDGKVINIEYDSTYYYDKYQVGDTVKVHYTKNVYENKNGIQKIKYSIDKIE